MVAVVVAGLDVIPGIRRGFKSFFFIVIDDVCFAINDERIVFV